MSETATRHTKVTFFVVSFERKSTENEKYKEDTGDEPVNLAEQSRVMRQELARDSTELDYPAFTYVPKQRIRGSGRIRRNVSTILIYYTRVRTSREFFNILRGRSHRVGP